ncbi:hypothetical protein HDU97_003819 [Phlyctochytrium planicorne]|nr:hypothetical protein HDU97_003819 [Phlyctochytrium planicorne]
MKNLPSATTRRRFGALPTLDSSDAFNSKRTILEPRSPLFDAETIAQNEFLEQHYQNDDAEIWELVDGEPDFSLTPPKPSLSLTRAFATSILPDQIFTLVSHLVGTSRSRSHRPLREQTVEEEDFGSDLEPMEDWEDHCVSVDGWVYMPHEVVGCPRELQDVWRLNLRLHFAALVEVLSVRCEGWVGFRKPAVPLPDLWQAVVDTSMMIQSRRRKRGFIEADKVARRREKKLVEPLLKSCEREEKKRGDGDGLEVKTIVPTMLQRVRIRLWPDPNEGKIVEVENARIKWRTRLDGLMVGSCIEN